MSSVDHFSDLWPLFFHFLFKHWETIPYPIYLISNYRSYKDPRVKTIKLGADAHWGSNLRNALKDIQADYIIYCQDDYLMSAPVKEDELNAALDRFVENDGYYLNLNAHKNYDGEAVSNNVGPLNLDNQWVIDLNAAVWKTSLLNEIVQDGWTPWDAESAFNRYAKGLDAKGAYTLTTDTIFPYIQAVKGGFWMDEAVQFCLSHSVTPDLTYRPSPPAGNNFFKKSWRSLLKRRMAVRRKKEMKSAKEMEILPLERRS